MMEDRYTLLAAADPTVHHHLRGRVPPQVGRRRTTWCYRTLIVRSRRDALRLPCCLDCRDRQGSVACPDSLEAGLAMPPLVGVTS